MDELHDNILVEHARGGDFAAFDQLVARHERRLYALALRLTGNHHDAQDAVQNALLSAVEHLDEFRGDSQFGTWITRITVNQALKLIEKRRVRQGVPLDEEDGSAPRPQFIADWRVDPARALDRKELREVLDEGMQRLPEGQRLVFVLRDIEGLSVAETAEALTIAPANVKVRLLRARLALREYLTERFGDPDRRLSPDHDGHDHSALLQRLTGTSGGQTGGQP